METGSTMSSDPIPANRTTRLCYLTLGLFTLLLIGGFVLGDGIAPAGRGLSKITGVDPPAYFAVSHSLLFHRGFNLSEEYSRVKPDDSPSTAVRKETGVPGSEYAIGYSFLAAPFLAIGTLMDAVAGNPADGYSRFAILGYCLTNVVLTGLGMMALFKFLRGLAEFRGVSVSHSAIYAIFSTFATFFGTNVGYYAFSPMSHASTFFCASMFLACWWRVRDSTNPVSWALLGVIGGFLSISRWQDIFFIGAPLAVDFLGGLTDFRKRLFSRMVYLAVAAVCWIPQMIEWKYMFGKYLTVPQGRNFFVFPPPFIPQVLFSTRNGWLAWTPLVALGLAGLIWAAIRVPRLFAPWLVVILLEVTLVGSLTISWHGGEGFSNRNLTSSAPLIAVGVLTLLCTTRRYIRTAVVVSAILCSLFSLISAGQFRLDLIPRSDRLTVSEYLTDKLRLVQVRKRKLAAREAENLLEQGSPAGAARVLEAAASYGPDRDVLKDLSRAYRESGRPLEAQDAEQRLELLMRGRLF
jgi:hypothetical protein